MLKLVCRVAVVGMLLTVLSACQSRYPACPETAQPVGSVDGERLWRDLGELASARMAGREPQTAGSRLAQDYIAEAFATAGLTPLGDSFRQPFVFKNTFSKHPGVNVVGWLPGRQFADQYLVISAHYDHLGKSGSKIFYGADDNASGVAAMLALARQLAKRGSRHSVIFLATDIEETGLYGAKAFLQFPPVAKSQLRYNLNLDMLARGETLLMVSSEKAERRTALRRQLIAEAGVCVRPWRQQTLVGRRDTGAVDFRRASDHWAFYRQDIPYLYLGGGVHKDYHTPDDQVDKIDRDHYQAVVETALTAFTLLDNQLASPPEPALGDVRGATNW